MDSSNDAKFITHLPNLLKFLSNLVPTMVFELFKH